MNRRINIYEAKTQFSRLVDDVAAGHTIIIAKNGQPMAQLGPLSGVRTKEPRKLGQLAGAAKAVDWTQWWRDWKASDKEIEKEFDAAVSKPLSRTRRKPIPKKRTGKPR